jgi:hypothetical protein
MVYTETDFDRLSWHDCHIWALELRVGDPKEGEWINDLTLDIDYITEWLCGVNGSAQFRVAPATLIFHGVTDLKLSVDWKSSGVLVALHPMSIGAVERERMQNQKIFLDRPYYKWMIHLNWPKGGEISFGAVGFTQTLLAEAVLTDDQCLSLNKRNRLKNFTGRTVSPHSI